MGLFLRYLETCRIGYEMEKYVMDRTPYSYHFFKQAVIKKSIFSRVSSSLSACIIASVFSVFLAASATAAVIEINGNKIQTDGALNATVNYTSEGLSITIPGVNIVIDCESCAMAPGQTDADQAALTPAFESPTPLDGGFTVQVSNYDAAYSWSAKSGSGSAEINGSGLVTVSGLTSGQNASVTVTTARSGYATGSATITGTAKTTNQDVGAPLVPLLSVPTSTADGFTVKVENFNAAYQWRTESSAGFAEIDDFGLVTVSGLVPEQSATVRVFASRSGYADGSAEKTGSAAPELEECKPGMDCYETCAPENRPADNSTGAQAEWDTACANYDPTPPGDTDETPCLPGMDCYETCAPENRPAANGSDAQAAWDEACADYEPPSKDDPEEVECPGPGYDCYDPVAGSGDGAGEVVADPFPIGAARVVKRAGDGDGDFDFGSAGRNGGSGRVYWTIEKGVVSVAGFTMSDEETPSVVRMSFGVTADQPSAPLHYWISKEQDGDSIQDCSYVGYAQTSQRVSIVGLDDVYDCQLERGEKYFINLAFCESEDGDIECRSAQAKSDVAGVVLAVRSSLIE